MERIRKSCAYCGGQVSIRNDGQGRMFVFCSDRCERGFRENMRKQKERSVEG